MDLCLPRRVYVPLVLGIAVLSVAACSGQGTSQSGSAPRGPSTVTTTGGQIGSMASPVPTSMARVNGTAETGGTYGSPGNLGTPSGALGFAGRPGTPTIGLGNPTSIATPEVAGAMTRQDTVTLNPENGSGVSGTATLSDLGNGRTRVVVLVTGSTGDHPAHIHDGACPNVDPTPKWPLSDVQNGTSTTDLDVSMDQITSSPTAINVHTSPQDDTPIACGTIQNAG